MSSEGFTSTYQKWGIIIDHSYLEERYFNNLIIYTLVYIHSVRSISHYCHRLDDEGQIWHVLSYSQPIIKHQSWLLLCLFVFSISPYTVHLCMREHAKMTFPAFSLKHFIFNNTFSFFHAETTKKRKKKNVHVWNVRVKDYISWLIVIYYWDTYYFRHCYCNAKSFVFFLIALSIIEQKPGSDSQSHVERSV